MSPASKSWRRTARIANPIRSIKSTQNGRSSRLGIITQPCRKHPMLHSCSPAGAPVLRGHSPEASDAATVAPTGGRGDDECCDGCCCEDAATATRTMLRRTRRRRLLLRGCCDGGLDDASTGGRGDDICCDGSRDDATRGGLDDNAARLLSFLAATPPIAALLVVTPAGGGLAQRLRYPPWPALAASRRLALAASRRPAPQQATESGDGGASKQEEKAPRERKWRRIRERGKASLDKG